LAEQSENGLTPDGYKFLVSGGTGQTSGTPDQRITNVDAIPAGPFQLTNGTTFTFNSYAASPVHRFYQMWQQLDCSIANATPDNPSGCDAKLFPWVETTVGAGTNGLAQPSNFSTDYLPGAKTTGEGATAMGFYNVQNGDAPYFNFLAHEYALPTPVLCTKLRTQTLRTAPITGIRKTATAAAALVPLFTAAAPTATARM
jgi:phospholipase C